MNMGDLENGQHEIWNLGFGICYFKHWNLE